MGWATGHIKNIQQGKIVQFRPRGNSMAPTIRSGDRVTVEPIMDHACINRSHIVLCRVRNRDYLHFVFAKSGDRYEIGNAAGHANGWTHKDNVYGVVTHIER